MQEIARVKSAGFVLTVSQLFSAAVVVVLVSQPYLPTVVIETH